MTRLFHFALTVVVLLAQMTCSGAQALTSSPLDRAMILADMGDLFDAEAIASRAVQENPMDAGAHAFLARFYLANPGYETTLERLEIDGNAATPVYTKVDRNAVRGGVHMKCLARMGEAGLDELAILLRDKNPKVAEEAAVAIGLSDSHRRVRILAGALEITHTPSVTAAVLRALGGTNSTEAYTLLAARLAALRKSGGAGGFARNLEKTLALLPNPAGMDVLKGLILSGTREEIASAARGLLRRPERDGVRVLLDMALQPAPFPEAAWSVMLEELRLESPAELASVSGALRSADPRVVQRALALAARQPDTVPLSDVMVRALNPRYSAVSAAALQRIRSLDDVASVRSVTHLVFDPASSDALRQEAVRALAATTETLRDVFTGTLAEGLSVTTVPLHAGALAAAALVTQDWGSTRATRLLVEALGRACAEDPGAARRLDQVLKGRALGPENAALLQSWIEGHPAHHELYRGALSLLSGLPDAEIEKLRPWALDRIRSDRPDVRRGALAVLNASMVSTGLKPGEERRLEQTERALATELSETPAGGRGMRDRTEEQELLRRILRRSKQLNERAYPYLD